GDRAPGTPQGSRYLGSVAGGDREAHQREGGRQAAGTPAAPPDRAADPAARRRQPGRPSAHALAALSERAGVRVPSRRRTAAAAGQQYLNQLRDQYQARFRHVNLTFDQYAELDALQAVVGDARSGDLEIELPGGRTRRVTEPEVVAAQLRQQHYQAHPLLRML